MANYYTCISGVIDEEGLLHMYCCGDWRRILITHLPLGWSMMEIYYILINVVIEDDDFVHTYMFGVIDNGDVLYIY